MSAFQTYSVQTELSLLWCFALYLFIRLLNFLPRCNRQIFPQIQILEYAEIFHSPQTDVSVICRGFLWAPWNIGCCLFLSTKAGKLALIRLQKKQSVNCLPFSFDLHDQFYLTLWDLSEFWNERRCLIIGLNALHNSCSPKKPVHSSAEQMCLEIQSGSSKQ